jgi:Zn-dependent protease
VLWPLGGLTIYGPTDQGAIGDLKVAIAGPLAHLPLAAIYAIVYTVVKKDGMDGLNSLTIHIEEMKKGFMYIFGTVCRVSFGWNVILFVGHILVPIYPLDGVRIWAGILRSMNVSLAKSAKIISVAGMLSSLIVFLYGCFTVFNIEVEGGVTEILLGGFGLTSSKILYDLVKLGRLTEDPVFGRACYVEHGNSVEIPSTDSNSTPAPSAGSTPIDNAEISEII